MDDADARPWRLSLRTLLVLTAVAAAACAGMVNANEWWLLAFRAGALVIVIAAAVSAVFDRGARQVFAIGFLICGALHLAGLRWIDEMPTRRLVELAYEKVGGQPSSVAFPSATGQGAYLLIGSGVATPLSGQLKMGDTGPLVSALQTALNARVTSRPPLTVDGDFGGQTLQAVTTFQTMVGQPADGIVTTATWKALGPVARQELSKIGAVAAMGLGMGKEFQPMGEWLFTLLVAYVGGLLAQAAYLRRK